MPTLWPLVFVLGVLLLLVVATMLGRRLVTATRPISRTFWCPQPREYVTVDFRATVWDHELLDVERCSAFVPSGHVTCDKACMRWRQPEIVTW